MELFGGTRDEQIKADLHAWLSQNRIYPGVADALRKAVADHEVYIVTTKQASQGAPGVVLRGWQAAQQALPCLGPAR